MRKTFFIFLLLFSLVIITIAWLSDFKELKLALADPGSAKSPVSSVIFPKLQLRSAKAKQFCLLNGFNANICFLIDMGLSSSKKRFFVYDLNKDTVIHSGLVTHGRCNEDWLKGRKYSNEPGSGCTSLGKYRIGTSYYGRFGLAFKLFGLQKTNDNAYKRFVVLHAHSCVPETEAGDEICQSDGCPTVSPGFLKQLNPIIKNSTRPVLLWIYN